MHYHEYAPHELLHNHVKCLWVLARDYTTVPGHVETVMPDSYLELVVNVGTPYYRLDGTKRVPYPTVALIGLLSKPLPLYCEGTAHLACIRFYPWGASGFLSSLLRRTRGSVMVLPFLSHEQLAALRELMLAEAYDQAVAYLQNVLLEKTLHTVVNPDVVNAAMQLLYTTKGRIKMDELADYCCTSLRQLERKFEEQVGLSPKALARNMRFNAIKKELTHDPTANLTQLALAYGYFDQAHFTKDFQLFAGVTPTAFCEQILLVREKLTENDNVVFLQ
jgi:AraC-like DNA-binding protein